MYRKIAVAVIAAMVSMATAKADDVSKFVQALPNEITEVDTAGSWTDGDKSGVFRAIVMIVPAKETTESHLVLQLMSANAEGTAWTVYKTIPVPQISDKKLSAISLSLEEYDTENEITWEVTGVDATTQADVNFLVKVNAKGVVEVKDAPKEEATPPTPEKK